MSARTRWALLAALAAWGCGDGGAAADGQAWAAVVAAGPSALDAREQAARAYLAAHPAGPHAAEATRELAWVAAARTARTHQQRLDAPQTVAEWTAAVDALARAVEFGRAPEFQPALSLAKARHAEAAAFAALPRTDEASDALAAALAEFCATWPEGLHAAEAASRLAAVSAAAWPVRAEAANAARQAGDMAGALRLLAPLLKPGVADSIRGPAMALAEGWIDEDWQTASARAAVAEGEGRFGEAAEVLEAFARLPHVSGGRAAEATAAARALRADGEPPPAGWLDRPPSGVDDPAARWLWQRGVEAFQARAFAEAIDAWGPLLPRVGDDPTVPRALRASFGGWIRREWQAAAGSTSRRRHVRATLVACERLGRYLPDWARLSACRAWAARWDLPDPAREAAERARTMLDAPAAPLAEIREAWDALRQAEAALEANPAWRGVAATLAARLAERGTALAKAELVRLSDPPDRLPEPERSRQIDAVLAHALAMAPEDAEVRAKRAALDAAVSGRRLPLATACRTAADAGELTALREAADAYADGFPGDPEANAWIEAADSARRARAALDRGDGSAALRALRVFPAAVAGPLRERLTGEVQALRERLASATAAAQTPADRAAALRAWAAAFEDDVAVAGQLRDATAGTRRAAVLAALFEATRTLLAARDDRDAVLDGAVPLWVFPGHGRDVSGGAFSPDSRALVTAGTIERLKEWRITTGDESPNPLVLGWFPNDMVAVTPDSRHLVVGGWYRIAPGQQEGTWGATIYRYEDKKVVRDVSLGDQQGVGLAISPDGRQFAIGHGEGLITVWAIAGGRRVAELRGHTGAVDQLEYSRDGQRLVSTSRDDTARLWLVRSGKPEHVLSPGDGGAGAARFAPDGQTVATAGSDGVLRFWDVATGAERRRLRLAMFDLHDVLYLPDARHAIVLGPGAPSVLHMESGQVRRQLEFARGTSYHGILSPNGLYLVTGTTDGRALVWVVPESVPE